MHAQSMGVRARAPFGTLSAARILVAADSATARLTLLALLEKTGYLVETADSSDDAIEKIEASQFALVLCALTGEGPGACQRVFEVAKSQDYDPAVAALRISAEDGDVSDEPDEMLIQPVEVPRLLTQITELLAGRAYGRAAAARKAG